MQEHAEIFPDWEYESGKVKDELGNKINRMSKGAIEEEVEMNYLAKILVEICLSEKDARPMDRDPLEELSEHLE